MRWIVLLRVKPEKSDLMMAGQLSQNMIAPDFSTTIQGQQPSGFDPQDFHFVPPKFCLIELENIEPSHTMHCPERSSVIRFIDDGTQWRDLLFCLVRAEKRVSRLHKIAAILSPRILARPSYFQSGEMQVTHGVVS